MKFVGLDVHAETIAVAVAEQGGEVRDLARAREVAKRDQLRARNRLTKFLLRHGKRPPQGVRPWTLIEEAVN
jgi:transposase